MTEPCVCATPYPDGNGDHCCLTDSPARCPCSSHHPRQAPRTYLCHRDEQVHGGVTVW
jgi:hypothetical protein